MIFSKLYFCSMFSHVKQIECLIKIFFFIFSRPAFGHIHPRNFPQHTDNQVGGAFGEHVSLTLVSRNITRRHGFFV